MTKNELLEKVREARVDINTYEYQAGFAKLMLAFKDYYGEPTFMRMITHSLCIDLGPDFLKQFLAIDWP